MKRLLCLVIVCAMASAASAASVLDIDVGGNPYEQGMDVGGSEIVTIQFIDTDGGSTGGFPVGTTIVVNYGDNAVHTWYTNPAVGSNNIVPAGDGYTWTGNALWIGGTVPQDGVIFTHEFHIPDGLDDSTDITIDYDLPYSDGEQDGQLILHVTPEPMTIGLLGLGALSLLRRRRKV